MQVSNAPLEKLEIMKVEFWLWIYKYVNKSTAATDLSTVWRNLGHQHTTGYTIKPLILIYINEIV